MSTVPLPTQGPTPTPPAGSSRRLVIILSVIGGALLIAVIALVFLMLGRSLGNEGQPVADVTGSPTPTASVTPTPTPTEEAPPPPQEDTTPRFTEFSAVTEVQCPNSGDKPEIQFSWDTAYATEVWYTSGNEDAIDDNYMQVPLSGSQNDLTDEHLFPCAHRETQDYTITLLGENGEHISEHWTVVDLNWNSGGGEDE